VARAGSSASGRARWIARLAARRSPVFLRTTNDALARLAASRYVRPQVIVVGSDLGRASVTGGVSMKSVMLNAAGRAAMTATAAALAVTLVSVTPSGARAGETEARSLLKAMSDYLAAQKTMSFAFDTNLEVVTKDKQKLLLASSGTVHLTRPDKVRATRSGGFARVETVFDGKTLTFLARNANAYAQVEIPGNLDNLMDVLRDKLHRPLPGADLLLSNVYEQLMPDVVDVKDLGSGVIGGVECDHLAFRNNDVDWQIWIAQGKRPYPCRYVITSKQVDQGPQYSIQIRNWKSGAEVAADNYRFTNATKARKIDVKELGELKELPTQFVVGGQ
jgi:hypothetical protein